MNDSLHARQPDHEEAYDIERICKAFIRLIDAPLVQEQERQPKKKRGEERATRTISKDDVA